MHVYGYKLNEFFWLGLKINERNNNKIHKKDDFFDDKIRKRHLKSIKDEKYITKRKI